MLVLNTGVLPRAHDTQGLCDCAFARRANGATKQDLVSVTIYLRTVGDYAAMNSVWDEWVPAGHTPARATVGAKLIDSEYRVEIQATAAIAVKGPAP